MEYVNHSHTVHRVWIGYDFVCHTIPRVQLRMLNHTLGIVWRGGMGLPVTPGSIWILVHVSWEQYHQTTPASNIYNCICLIQNVRRERRRMDLEDVHHARLDSTRVNQEMWIVLCAQRTQILTDKQAALNAVSLLRKFFFKIEYNRKNYSYWDSALCLFFPFLSLFLSCFFPCHFYFSFFVTIYFTLLLAHYAWHFSQYQICLQNRILWLSVGLLQDHLLVSSMHKTLHS